MSPPPEDPPSETGTPTLPKIPWPILLRYHLRKALQWRPWRTEAPSFGLGDQLGSSCRHFLKSYFWIMLPLVLGLFLGGYALLWEHGNIDWHDPHTWPSPWKLIKEFLDLENAWIYAVLLPAYLPIVLPLAAGWISFLYVPLVISWYAYNLRSDCEPDYGRWVPGLTALQAWTVVLSDSKPDHVMTLMILISSTVTAALITYYLCWYRPRRLLHEIDTERDLMREDLIEEIPPEEKSVSEA